MSLFTQQSPSSRKGPQDSKLKTQDSRIGTREFLEDRVEVFLDGPLVIALEGSEVADVADMIANARVVHVFGLQLPAKQPFEDVDRLEHRDAVRPAPSEVVDSRRARLLVEREERRADVV